MSKDMLILVDCQQDFFTGTLGNQNAINIIPNLVNLTKEFKTNDSLIFCTYDYHLDKDYEKSREGKYLPVRHCIDTEGSNLIPELRTILENYPDCYSLFKKDSFGFPDLYNTIRIATNKQLYFNPEMSYNIHIAGVVTNMCVLSVALNFQHLFTRSEIIIHSDACASHDVELHNKTLDVMRGLQMQVR